MASDPPKVLISYSHDSREHEQRVLELANRLRADGIDCAIDQYVVAPAEGWPRWMDKQIRDSGFVIMVCTETYYQRVMGEEMPGKGLGVRWEGHLIYQAIYSAESMNTKFIPVLFNSGNYAHIPAPVQSTTFHFAQTKDGYEDLYRRLTNQPRALKPALGKLRSLPPAERKSEGALGRLVNVPNLPSHFLPRPGDFLALKDAVLAGFTKPIALTGTGKIGVQGMGGIGKSVLAAALAQDSEVRQAFPDGVYWLTIGQKPNLFDLQNQLLRQLTGSKETLTTEQEAKGALCEALDGRAALVVVDDAWTIDHADAFSVTAPPARLLITTRNNEVLVGLGAEEHGVDVLSQSDALKMLAEWVSQKSPDKLPSEAAEVAKQCGYLPLALAMIGAMIRSDPRPTAWPDALARLKRADLEKIKRAFPGYPYSDLLRAIEVSIEALEESDRERYLDLAVFPEDQPIPEEALHVLWNLDEVDARDCVARFVARSLATWATDGSFILHDLQRDLIHKRREKDLPGLHLRLVEAWDAQPKLPNAYAWRWVPYHLVQAGRVDDLRRLLLDFDYLQAKLCKTSPSALIVDYNYFAEDEELRLIQSAIRLSEHILAYDTKQLAGQLTGRLLGIGRADIEALLKQAAERKAWPWIQPLTPSLISPGGALIRTFIGHSDDVYAATVTPDGRRVVSASRDETLRVWDLESGRTLRTLEGHTDGVSGVAVTPDGRRAVSASWDHTLRVWDLENGQTVHTLRGHKDLVRAVAVTPDGSRAVSGSNDRRLRIWDLESGHTIRTFKGHTGAVIAVAVTPDGRRAVSASLDGTLRLWDLESGRALRALKSHMFFRVMAVAVTPDGRWAVSASDDNTLRVWDLESGQTLLMLEGHTDGVSAVTVAPDGRRAVSGSLDKTLRIWDLESGLTIRALEGHVGQVTAVAVTPDGLRAVSASHDRSLLLWHLESGQTARRPEGHASSVRAVAATPDGRFVVSGSRDGTLRVWDLGTGQTLRTLAGHTEDVTAVAVTPDGHRAVSASADRTLRVWDLESGQTMHTLEGHEGKITTVAVTPDGCCAISGSSDQTLRVWDLESGQTTRTLRSCHSGVLAVAVTPDGRRAVSGSYNHMLQIWDLESGETLRILEGHTGSVMAVAVTPDGRHVVSGSADKMLRVWDLETGQPLRTLEGHTGEIWSLAITPDGHRALSSAPEDFTLRLWDLETGQPLRTLEGHENLVGPVAITPDGRRAVSGSDDMTLRVWDLERGEQIAVFLGDDGMLSYALAPDGQTIIAGDGSGRVHFLRLVEADETSSIGNTKIQLLHRKEQAT